MSDRPRDEKPAEKPAVRTTIVGGRPPGSGQEVGPIPLGMEILIQKAAVDPEFRKLLLEKRAEAAREIDLPLEPAEADMLNTVSAEQLEAIIAKTKVPEEARRALLGKAAGVTLAALGVAGVASLVCLPTLGHNAGRPGSRPSGEPAEGATRGIQPDRPPSSQPAVGTPQADDQSEGPPEVPPDHPVMTRGISPDRPPKSRPHG